MDSKETVAPQLPCPHCHANPCTCPHGWPETPKTLKISEADLRGVFGHKCDQPNCPVCHPDMSLTEMAELYEHAASQRHQYRGKPGGNCEICGLIAYEHANHVEAASAPAPATTLKEQKK